MTNVRAQARAAVQVAVRRQALHKPTTCSDCGKTCAPHGHHEDYARVLQVVWLCASCHGKRHCGRIRHSRPDEPARVHVQIPDSLKAAVDAQAAAEQRTIKAVVVRALEAYLAEHGGAAA